MRVYRAYYYDDTEEPDNSPSIHSRALYLEYEHTWRKVDDLIAPTRGFVLATRWGGGPPGVSTEPFGRIVAQLRTGCRSAAAPFSSCAPKAAR